SRFCNECGNPVAAPSVAAAALVSPESYTPRYLAQKILTSRHALEGERKQVTVLFADMKGSMELLAARDPEEARKILDPVLERMMEAVHRYEGTVNQVMGDGIMALFGAPRGSSKSSRSVRFRSRGWRAQSTYSSSADHRRRARAFRRRRHGGSRGSWGAARSSTIYARPSTKREGLRGRSSPSSARRG